MATAAVDTRQHRGSDPSQSPVYPGRPIRPLPKHRIRSRLSSEQADSIVYPPIPSNSSPMYGSPMSQNERSFAHNRMIREAEAYAEDFDHDHNACGGHYDEDSGDEGAPWSQRASHGSDDEVGHYSEARMVSQYGPPPPNSSTSSADSYESFENTNNKKKRKIPISGGAGAPLPADAGLREVTQSVNVPYREARPGSGAGLSGPGRGRYSRSHGRLSGERRPLASTTSNVHAYAHGTEKGIISSAMANAKGYDGYVPARGQENVSLLQSRQKQGKDGSQSFTFEMPSDSAEKLAMAQPPPAPPSFPRAPNVPTSANRRPVGPPPNGSVPAPGQYAPSNQPPPQQAPPPQKPRRDPDWWRRAAARRKDQKRVDTYYNPPNPKNPDDNYFCLFCEYEQIFGHPPMYLGRQYELKERRRRRDREANQKRLEAAKAKSRKGKKSKGGAKNSNAATNSTSTPHAQQPYDPAYTEPPHDQLDPQDEGSQGEDFFDDEYDDGIPAPAPLGTHGYARGVSNVTGMDPPPLPHGIEELPELDRSQSLPARM